MNANVITARAFAGALPLQTPRPTPRHTEATEQEVARLASSDLGPAMGIMIGCALGALGWVVLAILTVGPAPILALGGVGAFLVGKSAAEIALQR